MKPPAFSPLPDLGRLAQALRRLLPATAAVAATDPQADHAPWPGEAIVGTPARLREFAAGRAALRAAMATLHLPPVAVPMRPDRSPALPPGLAASITHTANACLAAALSGARGLGIDLEPDLPLPPDTLDTILTPAELCRTAAADTRLVFAAKEALYKAQYPVTQALFDFQTIEISLQHQGFAATFLRPVPPFAAGAVLGGRWVRAGGHVVAAVLIP